MLASGTASRWQTASIATLISHAPSPTLLPVLKKIFDDEIRRYHAFREEAKASGWRQGKAVTEARTLYTVAYQRAFTAIKSPETTALMGEYLADEYFGELAARVLAIQWSEANEPRNDTKFRSGVDFTHVDARRAARAVNPSESSTEADMIFGVVDSLIAESATEEQNMLAVKLGIIGALLPHSQRSVTIQKLIALAPRPARANLLLSLVLSGEDVDIRLVADGIAETFEAAEKEKWILAEGDGYQLRAWLRLLPLATPVSELPAVVRTMPDAWRNPNLLELCPPFEKYMIEGGIQLIKIWLEVGKDEQERRFLARINDPLRQWKLSPMDIESYQRRYEYSRARDTMLERTDTPSSPWWIVFSDNKRRARLNCISHVLSLIPSERAGSAKAALPKRSAKGKYDDQAVLRSRNLVPEKY